MIKYLGSKRVLVPAIRGIVERLPGVRRVVDLFSGTARVGHALKGAGFRVHANDHNAFAATLARCYVAADAGEHGKEAEALIRELGGVKGKDGWFTETYCRRSRYFRPENGARIEAIREAIRSRALSEPLESILLVSLMEAADRVDSTTGVQMAYLKSWAPRAFNPLELRLPRILPGPGSASCMDAAGAAESFSGDLVYLDPPYNQHSYLCNYHIWETLVAWDRPDVYGVAMKRIDCRSRKSDFNSKPRILPALTEVLGRIDSRYLIVSFNDEGYVVPEALHGLLAKHGEVLALEFDYKRYVGAQIGIYNPKGHKVGTIKKLRNKEFLFVVSKEAKALRRLEHLPNAVIPT
ncbi:MAG: DNA adenine methylase [Planctomycetota bacterium]